MKGLRREKMTETKNRQSRQSSILKMNLNITQFKQGYYFGINKTIFCHQNKQIGEYWNIM